MQITSFYNLFFLLSISFIKKLLNIEGAGLDFKKEVARFLFQKMTVNTDQMRKMRCRKI